MDNKEMLKKIRSLNELLEDYLDRVAMDEAEEEEKPCKGKKEDK